VVGCFVVFWGFFYYYYHRYLPDPPAQWG
jgi:hypothetical protein